MRSQNGRLDSKYCVITITESVIKRTGVEEFKLQNRGGKGVIGSGQKKKIQLNFTNL